METIERHEERVRASLPVTLAGGATGTTRDICPTGVYFETDVTPVADEALEFTVDMNPGAGAIRLCCKGTVVRIDRLGQRIGVAVRILESKLEWRSRSVIPAISAAGNVEFA